MAWKTSGKGIHAKVAAKDNNTKGVPTLNGESHVSENACMLRDTSINKERNTAITRATINKVHHCWHNLKVLTARIPHQCSHQLPEWDGCSEGGCCLHRAYVCEYCS